MHNLPMTWTARANSALGRVAGVRLVRVAAGQDAPEASEATEDAGDEALDLAEPDDDFSVVRPPRYPEVDRLLRQPIFIFAPVRSGSTLLRSLLGAHSQLHAPHEMHIRKLRVRVPHPLGRRSMRSLGHNRPDLEHLLWDRVMHRELCLSGKDFFVDKTPSNAWIHRRIATSWPDARFIFLIRHPSSIAASWAEASRGRRTLDEAARDALRYMEAVQGARDSLDGLTVRYEDLTERPELETRRICEFLGLDWESEMLDYGSGGSFEKGLGDWTAKIRSGRVQPGRPLPPEGELHEALRDLAQVWGYADPQAT